MPSVTASGTQAATVGTEHTLTTQTTSGVYVLVVNCQSLAAGDTVELRLKMKTASFSGSQTVYKAVYSGAQGSDDLVKISLPLPITHQLDATLKQTAGTGRSYDWELVAL